MASSRRTRPARPSYPVPEAPPPSARGAGMMVGTGESPRPPRLTKEQLQEQVRNLEVSCKSLLEQRENLGATCEQFLEGSRVALEVLGELIPKVNDVTIRSRLGVVEDILEGANVRYTD